MSTKLTRKSERAKQLADRATATLDAWLETGKRADKREADLAYDDLIEACPVSLEGIAAVVGHLAYRQQVLLEDIDEPEIHSAFRSDVDAFVFIQCLDDAMRRMLARAQREMPVGADRLSSFFADVLVRDAFRRAEGDDGEGSPAPIVPPPPCLSGAAVRQPEMA